MSSFKFPSIETKKSILDDEEYNFVNKDKRKQTKPSTPSPIDIVDDLKRKIQDQRRQIDFRNATIQGLQRNFESLSALVKSEKTANSTLKAELELAKSQADMGHQRAAQIQEKLSVVQHDYDELKSQFRELKVTHRQCQGLENAVSTMKHALEELQQNNERALVKLSTSEQQRRQLQAQVAEMRQGQKQLKGLKDKYSAIEAELNKANSANALFKDQLTMANDHLQALKVENSKSTSKQDDFLLKIKDLERQIRQLQLQVSSIVAERDQLNRKLGQVQNDLESKSAINRIKSDDDQKSKLLIKELKDQLQRENAQVKSLNLLLNEETLLKEKLIQRGNQLAQKHQKQTVLLKQCLSLRECTLKENEQKYSSEIDKLFKQIQNLQASLSHATASHQRERDSLSQATGDKIARLSAELETLTKESAVKKQKYGQYLEQIDSFYPNVLVVNSKSIGDSEKSMREMESTIASLKEKQKNDKAYINSLQEQVRVKSVALLEKSKQLQTYKDEENSLSNLLEQQRLNMKKVAEQKQRAQSEALKRLEQQKNVSQREIKAQKELLEERMLKDRMEADQKLSQQHRLAEERRLQLEQYQQQERNLKALIDKEQKELSRIATSKEEQIARLVRLKEQQLEKARKNNELLESDNSKLKEMEARLKQEAQRERMEKEEQLKRLQLELTSKYESVSKASETNSKQLKKVLEEKAAQMTKVIEENKRLRQEIQSGKGRLKELEGTVSRTQRSFKDRIDALEEQVKTSKRQADVTQAKLKDAEMDAQTQLRKFKEVQTAMEELRKKFEGQKVQQKLALVAKLIQNMQLTLKTLCNTLSCCYCVELVKDCVRVAQCGHIFCRKCKMGYEPKCGECHIEGQVMSDKLTDETVSKADYMRILLTTIKDDLNKMSC